MAELTELDRLVNGQAIEALERQAALADLVGGRDWRADLAAGQFWFEQPRVDFAPQVVGTSAPGPDTWCWGWASPMGFAPELAAASVQLREFGARHGLDELTTGEVPRWPDPDQQGWRYLIAAQALTGASAMYRGPAGGGGATVWFLLDAPDRPLLDAPETARVLRVITEALSSGWITDGRSALAGYAARRAGMALTDGAEGPALEFAAGRIEFRLDELGRIAGMTAPGQAEAADDRPAHSRPGLWRRLTGRG